MPWVILLAEMNPLLLYWMNRSINKGRIKNYSSKLKQGFPFILFWVFFVLFLFFKSVDPAVLQLQAIKE